MAYNVLSPEALILMGAFLALCGLALALRGSPQGDPRAQDSHVLVALLVMVLVFAVIYYFIDELMVAITALIGGVLAGAGVFLMTQNAVYGGAALGAVFLLGAPIQYAFAKRRERRTEAYPG